MITNPEKIKGTYICNKHVAHYLIYEKHFPLLGFVKGNYYFTMTAEMEKVVDEFPFWVRLMGMV